MVTVTRWRSAVTRPLVLARLLAMVAVCLVTASGQAAGRRGAADDSAHGRQHAHPVGDTEHVDAYVAELQQRYHLRGVAVVVIRDGAIVVESGQGVAGPSGEPVTADTPFRIGSTSKQLTGLLIQQLIAEGRPDARDDDR
jgi:CubicO group peptidase (beta-lactamase class C family)